MFKMWFLLREGGGGHSIIFLMIGQSNGPLQKKIKTFMFWGAPQLINLNQNKYLSSYKSLGQEWWWTKLGIKVLLKQWDDGTMQVLLPLNL